MNFKPPPAAAENFSPEQLASAALDMAGVLDQYPELGDFGFGVFDGRRYTPDERKKYKEHDRETIQEPRSLAQFLVSRQWLRQFPKLKAINTRGTSYGLKHRAEHDIGYITNGVFIAAAVAEGFRIKREGWSPNACFNISSLAWRTPQTHF